MAAVNTSTGERGAGGGGSEVGRGGGKSWAALLSSNLPSVWNKNVLEVVLEKDERGSFNVSESDCARVMRKLGIDQRPGVHVEGVQICPNGRGVLLITLKKEVPIEMFCRHDVIEVTESGIRAVHVKPAGKREVVVTMKGIHPNTRDDGVVDYLSKYGRLVTSKVIYGVFGDGPLQGIRNGDRLYKVELKPSINLGTYHVIDGQKVTARYPGQQQTCARCFGTPQTCPGKGMARRCEQEGGPRTEFTDYIFQLWDKIGYNPGQVELSPDINEENVSQDGGRFTPVKVPVQDTSKFAGVCVNKFPKETDPAEIIEFMIYSGLAETHKDKISIKPNGTVIINNLQSSECEVLIAAIHNKTDFGKKLYCNGIVPLTPVKPDEQPVVPLPNLTQPPASQAVSAALTTTTNSTSPSQPIRVPDPLSPMTPDSFSGQINNIGPMSIIPETPDVHHMQLSSEQLVRRHSQSLRSPPAGSVAQEILDTVTPTPANHYAKAKNILSGLKEMTEKFSDFGSCQSDSSQSELEDQSGYKTQGRNKKSGKHRLSPTSPRDFLKKQNTAASPQNYY